MGVQRRFNVGPEKKKKEKKKKTKKKIATGPTEDSDSV